MTNYVLNLFQIGKSCLTEKEKKLNEVDLYTLQFQIYLFIYLFFCFVPLWLKFIFHKGLSRKHPYACVYICVCIFVTLTWGHYYNLPLTKERILTGR